MIDQDTIIKLARETDPLDGYGRLYAISVAAPETLALFAQAAYRQGLEDAAKVCETEWSNVAEKLYGQDCAAAIRALMKETP